jgi:hypothetical protein
MAFPGNDQQWVDFSHKLAIAMPCHAMPPCPASSPQQQMLHNFSSMPF